MIWRTSTSWIFFAGLAWTTVIPGHAAQAQSPLTWEACARMAREAHPDILAARAAVRAGEAGVGGSRAAYLPDLDGSVDYSRPHSTSTGDKYSYGLSASQRLFPGLADQPEVAQAKLNLEADRAELAAVSAAVRSDLRTAFVGLLHAQEFLTLAEKISGRRRKNVDLVKARFDAGREHRGSFLRARAQAGEADFDVRQARRAVRVARQELIEAMGRSAHEDILVSGTFETDTPVEDAAVETLADRTPAVRKAAASRQSSELGLTIERRKFYPTVSLSGSATRSAGRWPPPSTAGDWSSALSLSVPLFSGGSERYDVAAAAEDFRRQEFLEQSTRNAAALDLRDKLAAHVDAVESVDIRSDFLEAARLRAEIAQAQYTSGLLTYQDWDIIENDLIAQEKFMLAARRDAVIAEAAWDEAIGKGLEP
ncbi:TolC family protein [bacterium]|nr:TolC family protein [bacterium]